MSDGSLTHYGIKGMRWGHRESDDGGGWIAPGGSSQGGGSATATRSRTSAPAKARTQSRASRPQSPPRAVRRAAPVASPSRSFRDPAGKKSKDFDSMTPEQRAHRKKMIIGGVAVVGILGAAAVGTAAYKGTPPMLRGMEKLSLASQAKVAGVMAHPRVMDLRLQGGRKVDAVKLNALFKQAELAERGSKSPLGILASRKAAAARQNPTIARAGIRQGLNELRNDTEQIKAMNDAEDVVAKIIRDQTARASADRYRNEAQILEGLRGRKAPGILDDVDEAFKVRRSSKKPKLFTEEQLKRARQNRAKTPVPGKVYPKGTFKPSRAEKQQAKKMAEDMNQARRAQRIAEQKVIKKRAAARAAEARRTANSVPPPGFTGWKGPEAFR